MKIVFKAKDGTMFNSAEACVQYEAELANREKEWEAWGWNGKPTDITTNAVVVNLPTEESVAQFLAKADFEDDGKIEGIDKDSRGWYYYDEGVEKYIGINEDIVRVFQHNSVS